LFKIFKVNKSDNTRVDLIVANDQHLYLKATDYKERQKWLVALASQKAIYPSNNLAFLNNPHPSLNNKLPIPTLPNSSSSNIDTESLNGLEHQSDRHTSSSLFQESFETLLTNCQNLSKQLLKYSAKT
jgi:hypothetical protein